MYKFHALLVQMYISPKKILDYLKEVIKIFQQKEMKNLDLISE